MNFLRYSKRFYFKHSLNNISLENALRKNEEWIFWMRVMKRELQKKFYDIVSLGERDKNNV